MKHLIWILAITISVGTVGCAKSRHHKGEKKEGSFGDTPEEQQSNLKGISKPEGDKVFAETCKSDISLTDTAQDKKIDSATKALVDGKDGSWVLVSVRGFRMVKGAAAATKDDKPVDLYVVGRATGPFEKNGETIDKGPAVTCHNTKLDKTQGGKGSTSKDLTFKVPNLISSKDGKVTSTAELILQARKGRVGAVVKTATADFNVKDSFETNVAARLVFEDNDHRIVIRERRQDAKAADTTEIEAIYKKGDAK